MNTSNYELSAEDLRDRRENGESLTVLDIREPREREVAKLPDDLWIPMGEIGKRTDELTNCDRPIVVYCHHGMRSLKVTKLLREEGLEDVYSLAGGIDYWAREINPEISRY